MIGSRFILIVAAAALSVDSHDFDSLGRGRSAATIQSVQLSDTSVTGGVTVIGTIVLTALAAVGGDTVAISSSPGRIVNHPPSVVVPKGNTQATFTITTTPTTTTQLITITASAASSQKTATLRLRRPIINSVALSRQSVQGGRDTLSAIVNLDGIAPSGGIPAPLTIAPQGLVAIIPPGGVCTPNNLPNCIGVGPTPPPAVAPGATQAVVPLNTVAVRSPVPVMVIAGNYGAQVQLRAPAAHSISFSSQCSSGSSSQVISGPRTLRLSASVIGPISSSNGAFVSLTSSSPSATVPSTVEMTDLLVPPAPGLALPGTIYFACVDVQIQAVAQNTPLTLTSTAGGTSTSLSFTVLPVTLSSLSIVPELLRSGLSAPAEITLSAPAAQGGAVVTLTSSNPAVAAVPSSITVAENGQNKTFNIPLTVPASHPDLATGVIITASFAGRTLADTVIVRR